MWGSHCDGRNDGANRRLTGRTMGVADEDKAFLGMGWAFPVVTDPSGEIALAAHEEDIRQAVRIILGTVQGERVMRPDFGAGLRALVFEPINQTTIALAQHRVEEALILW